MTLPRSARIPPAPLAAAALACLLALVHVQPAAAVRIENRGTAALDGKVVMSPAAERVSTIEPDGGEQVGPGSVVRRPVIIHNRSAEAIQFDLDVREVVGSTAELVVDVLEGRGGAAAWVQLQDTTFTLKPGQQATTTVTIRVPERVKPGSKPFAVTATQRPRQVQAGGAGIAPQFKQVAIFIVELPGDAPVKGEFTRATITSAQLSEAAGREGTEAPTNVRFYLGPGWTDAHDLRLATEYVNDGERLLNPSGRVVVRDLFGRVAGRYELDDFTVYPGGEAAQTVELKGLPSLGVFTARVELRSEAAGRQSATLPRFVMVPRWLAVALGAFAAYGLYRLAAWRIRRRREWRRYLAGEGDTGDDWGQDGDLHPGDREWALDEDVERT